MSTTPNLLLSYIVASQNQKEVTANAAILGLEEALTDSTSIAMTDADYTFSIVAGSPALSNMVFTFTGTLTQARHVILPPNAKLYIVMNGTGSSGSPVTPNQSLIFKVGSGTNIVTVDDEAWHLIYCDGVNSVYEIGGNGSETVASGVATLSTNSIPSGSKSSILSIQASGVLATDVVAWDFASDPSGMTGFAPSSSGMLQIIAFCTAGFVNFYVYNNTGSPIVPNGNSSPLTGTTLNWHVTR